MNTPKSSSFFMIFIISFISSFKINKVNPFTALTAPSGLIFPSNLSSALIGKLLANQDKLSVAKGFARPVITFSSKLPNILGRNPPDRIILDI